MNVNLYQKIINKYKKIFFQQHFFPIWNKNLMKLAKLWKIKKPNKLKKRKRKESKFLDIKCDIY
jgi:hypothetical protein